MRIFLDTANIEEIKKGLKLGVVSGVTTNPTLIAKEGISDYKSVVQQICALLPEGDVSAEITAEGPAEMLKQAREIAKWAPNVVVKIPATAEGLEIISKLSKEGVRFNMTLCFSVNQALLGALAGAAFVSPFVGRLDDAGHDGMMLINGIVSIYKEYGFETQVIAASIRHPLHCTQAAQTGAGIATVPYKVLMQMMQHPLTDSGIARFMADWKSVQK